MSLPEGSLELIRTALHEDVGPGDWTSEWTVPADRRAKADVVAKQAGIVSGLDVASAVFRVVDPDLNVRAHVEEGASVEPGDVVLEIDGSARSILTGERVALNLLQRLAGVATLTRRYVDAVRGTRARILDTRKTTPGMRSLEKRAVRAGGGDNHRAGLYDMILIKENHISASGGITAAVAQVQRRNTRGLAVEVEVTNLEELREAIHCGADRVLLDNMAPEVLRDAVAIARDSTRPVETEASGGISLDTVRQVADTGVDLISVGALTHSAPALDLSLLVRRP